MKVITKYQAKDGRCFSEQEPCIVYEQLLERIDSIMQPLISRPDDCDFTNGGGYIQQEAAVIEEAKSRFFNITNSFLGKDAKKLGHLLGRYLDDMHSPLYNAWHRIQCIDKQYREWGQIYYANNPNKGTQAEYKERK